jgi:hypothetical protein
MVFARPVERITGDIFVGRPIGLGGGMGEFDFKARFTFEIVLNETCKESRILL